MAGKKAPVITQQLIDEVHRVAERFPRMTQQELATMVIGMGLADQISDTTIGRILRSKNYDEYMSTIRRAHAAPAEGQGKDTLLDALTEVPADGYAKDLSEIKGILAEQREILGEIAGRMRTLEHYALALLQTRIGGTDK